MMFCLTTSFNILLHVLVNVIRQESACSAGDRVQFLGWEDSLEKEMATHSSILA